MRSPICAFLGHVDAGKTSIMDSIRNTFFVYKETGGLTQNIGVTEVPTDRINDIAGSLLKRFSVDVKTPSLIFIDSPGHEAFVTLRERGASIADLAILTVDVNAGIQNQTIESIEILKSYKTPFLVALTKIDTLAGFVPSKDVSFLDLASSQPQKYIQYLDEKLYSTIAQLSMYSFQAERYDRVRDFTKEVAIVPVSSINRIGINDLLVMIIGLGQKYIPLEKNTGNKAAILEEKMVKGLGTVYDSIVYSGSIEVGDKVMAQTKEGPVENKVKGIMKLAPMEESRENFGEYISVKRAEASSPIRLTLQEPNALIGTSVSVFKDEAERHAIVQEMKHVSEGFNDENAKGLVVCADSFGSIDAIKKIGLSKGIQIGKTKISPPSKAEIMTAKLNQCIILCFNTNVEKTTEALASGENVVIIKSNSIYDLFEKYDEFASAKKKSELMLKTENIRLPGKMVFLEKNIFRRSDPCVFGVEILAGEIRPGYGIMNDQGKHIGKIISMEEDKKKLDRATCGQKLAISVDDAVYGRNIADGDVLYTDLDISDIIKLGDMQEIMGPDYMEALSEIQKIKHF